MNMRRKFGKAVFGLALALPLVLGVQAQAQDNVSLRLNWYLGGLHVPFYYGVDRGFYRQEGINLTINEGRGSANTVQVVGAGTDTFGLADSSSIINLVSKGGEIKSVMNILSSTGFSVVSAASAGIRTPKDIEGKTLAVSPGDPIRGLLEALAAHNKVDISKVRFVQVDPAAKVVTVPAWEASGLAADRVQLENAIAVLAGVAAPEFRVAASAGMPAVPVIPAGMPSDLLERRPDIAQAERALEAATAKFGVASLALYPSLRIAGNGGFMGTDFGNLFEDLDLSRVDAPSDEISRDSSCSGNIDIFALSIDFIESNASLGCLKSRKI
jgi:ABC-type nitrate/sulfonate/bicarbonate transport system substrate-binding protein